MVKPRVGIAEGFAHRQKTGFRYETRIRGSEQTGMKQNNREEKKNKKKQIFPWV